MSLFDFKQLGAKTGTDPFPDPFMDYASLVMPENNAHALMWSEFMLSKMGIYESALSRVVGFFLTDLKLEGSSTAERDRYREFLEDTLGIKAVLRAVAMDYLCFHGDTKAVTRNGVYTLRELAGRTVDVLSEDGVYRPATFKSFGRQELLEVTLADDRKILATPEHQWVVQKSNGGTVRVPTTKLRGRRIERTVAPRPPKNDDFYAGVRHGFTFGDGTLYNDGKQARANFYGAKDLAMLPYFEGHGSPAIPTTNPELMLVHGMPPQYKQLPANDASAAYWYGFVCGFLAADGSVDTYGCTVLTQATEATLKAIALQLPRIGMVAGPVRGHNRVADLSAYNGTEDAIYEGPMYYVTLLKQFMQIDDILLPEHRAKFLEHSTDTNYGKFIGVTDVQPTGIVDEVFCCVEDETHTFVLENGVLTGNCYGNSFTSLIVPFRRYLSCKRCGFEAPIKNIKDNGRFRYRWQGYKFMAYCPFCHHDGEWTHTDRRSGNEGEIKVRRWNPKEMELLWDPYTDNVKYVWRVPGYYRTDIRKGELIHIENAPWELIETVAGNANLEFSHDVLYHMKVDTLAGIYNRGWGISPVLARFTQAWYVQVLHRCNEAIGMDYVFPLRMLSPEPRGGSVSEAGDPLFGSDLGGFAGSMSNILRHRKQDPMSWHVSPYPVKYQMMGAEANQMAPFELLDQGIDTLLNSIGVPVEFYKGSMALQTAPAALRLMESNWSHLTHSLNRFLQWLVNRISEVMAWDKLKVRLERPSHADDLNRQLARLQLATSGMMSQTSGLKSIGADFREEQRLMLEEQKFVAEESQTAQEEIEASQMGKQMAAPPPPPGQAPAGGAPPAGGGAAPPADPSAAGMPPDPVETILAAMPDETQPVSPPELYQAAETIAQQAMGLSDTQRISMLRRLKQKNQAVWALVKTKIEEQRQQFRTQGQEAGQQAAQQAAQQGISMPAPA